MGDYFCLQNLGTKKQRVGLNFVLVLRQVLNMTLIKKNTGVSVKDIYVEWSRFFVVLDEPVRGLKHEENVLLKINVEAWVINMRDAKRLCIQRVCVQLHEKVPARLAA